MRSLALVGLVLSACAAPVPVGVYRMPVQTGDKSVALKTLLVRQEDADLVLLDVATAKELARGPSQFDWSGTRLPYELSGGPYPIRFYLRDGVIQDAAPRPYDEVPDPPIAPKATTVTRVTLSSGSDHVTFNAVDGALFGDVAHPQPALGTSADALAILDSPAGGGLWLPANPAQAATWHDAVSTAIPPDAQKPVACAAPLVSTYRVVGDEDVTVPAGPFHAMHLSEIVDSCLRKSPTDVKVYVLDRWFVPGLGPVRLSYQASDGSVRDYRLTKANVKGGSSDTWPLAAGDSWTFEVHAPDGSVVNPAEVVKVEAVRDVAFP